ncbi:translocation protein SEC63 homolog [Callorhinchus milii]|uniref:Translocation protein SEC63 homolog n=1 Tax=Callorhinchus milii TaxID=7868 RepID=V9KBL9_CALMI|nr:translocation protein SEC63 homolog [Callorhinchus milii]|eukprot:gi/632951063/ref/XP_007891088.1/ PREDICTED: translocation protein SEC63 homolog [Callorhinchus milii]
MAGQQFQYDDSGNTSFYFLTSFVGLLVIPATFYLWPRDLIDEKRRIKTLGKVHGQCLWYQLHLRKAGHSTAPTLKKVSLICGWILLCCLLYKVSIIENREKEYNPYEVLGVDPGASIGEIKKQYRQLSLKHHPDKGGDEVLFMRIAKAYAALTDEESRKNWEEFGNPDGPQATTFGIALPSWIVDQKNSMLVLAVYGFAFMVILPVVVGTWWYRSIRYSGDQILIQTTQLYMHFMNRTPNMNMKRLIMVLTAAFEFDPRSSKEAVMRPTDNTEIPLLIRELGNVNEKKKELPFCLPYSVKARVLLHAHLSRLDITNTLEEDYWLVIRKCPGLLQEMINVGCQLTMMANTRGGIHAPRLESIENCMKLSQMLVQSLWDFKSPLLQLPHFEEEHLKYCWSKKYKIRTVQDLVSMKDADRRSMLRFLSEEKYDGVMAVLSNFPHVSMEVKLQVLDDEDSSNITAGSIVTVTVLLRRGYMATMFEKEQEQVTCPTEEQESEETQANIAKNKKKVWQKNKGAKKPSKSKKKKAAKKKAPTPTPQQPPAEQQKQKPKHSQANGSLLPGNDASNREEDDDELSDKGSDSEEETTNKDSQSDKDDDSDKEFNGEKDDEAEWEALQQSIQRRERALLETKSKITHPVHTLYFPEEKQEWWWLYIADRKAQTLISMPYHVCTLQQDEEIELKFSAPCKTGNYQYFVILRSDSYMGLDLIKPLKFEVEEAKHVPETHPQWDIPETEEEEEDQEDSEGIEDSEEDEEDNDSN